MRSKYVLKSLNRRKIRTILMLLALIVGVGALVALNATVDTYERFYLATISNSAGDYDLVITKSEIEAEQLISEQIIPTLQGIDPQVSVVAPRIQGVIDLDAPGEEGEPTHGSAKFAALNYNAEDMGDLQLISGTINMEPGYAVVLQETADTFGLKPGDTFDISYALPIPRQEGVESASDVSTRQARTTLTVSGIALQLGVTGEEGNNGVLVDLAYAQNWLGIPGQAERVIVAFDKAIYNNNDPQAAAFQARYLSEQIQNMLGEASRRAGVEVTPHILRHTYAYMLRKNGVQPEVRARLMGHSIEMALRYGSPKEEEMNKAVESLDNETSL